MPTKTEGCSSNLSFLHFVAASLEGGNICRIKRWMNKSLGVELYWKTIKSSRVCINTDSTFNAAHMSLRWPMIHNALTTKLYSIEFLGCGNEGGIGKRNHRWIATCWVSTDKTLNLKDTYQHWLNRKRLSLAFWDALKLITITSMHSLQSCILQNC